MSIIGIIGCGIVAFILLMFGRGVYYGFLAKKYYQHIDMTAGMLMHQHLMDQITEEEMLKQMNDFMTDLFNGRHKGYQEAVLTELQKRIPQAKEMAVQMTALVENLTKVFGQVDENVKH